MTKEIWKSVHGYKVSNKGSVKNKLNKVNQLTLDGELVKVFDSIREASRYTGIPTPNIINCCKGNLNKTHGFKWCYA